MAVKSVMSTPVVMLSPAAGFRDVLECLRTHRLTAVPIVDGQGRPLGVVSESDLMLREQEGVRRGRFALRRRRRQEEAKAEALTAAGLMSSPPITIREDEAVRHAARLMHDRGVRRLIVVDERGLVVGVVSRRDVLRVFDRSDHQIAADIRALMQLHFWTEPMPVRVDVEDGLVTLEGTTDLASEAKWLAGRVAEVDGVVKVDSKLDFVFDDLSVTTIGGRWLAFR